MSNAPRQRLAAEPAGPQRSPAADADTAVAHGGGSALPAWSDSPRQLKQAEQLTQLQPAAAPSATAQGGLPDGLRSGIEALSGIDMSGVRVHRNSTKPAALQAHAYAQGQDIHLGPGQEKHLPHEAWHVVQQAQGRVRPTMQMKAGVPVNDDAGLEREADVMGAKATQIGSVPSGTSRPTRAPNANGGIQKAAIQRKVGFEIEVLPYRIQESDERQLAKAEVLHQADGWKLTPDGHTDDNWTPEYVVAAIDETTNADQIPVVLGQVAAHARDQLQTPQSWSAGQDLTVYEDMDQELVGNFHVTGGLRLSRLAQVIKLLYPGDEALATRAEGTHYFDENYKNVVALIALQVADLVNNPGQDGASAKQRVSMLSRTDLGLVLAKVKGWKRKETFVADVLTASQVARNARLFNHVLPGSGGSGRTIDDQQNLTVSQWLDQLWTGADYVWSETADDQGGHFPMERVGPSTLGHRAEGVILELRALQEQGVYSPRVDDWADVGVKYATIFRMLNDKKTNPQIRAALE
ncbi:DUF4157 domain-containing protein [Paucibacter sp. APW11]|uniref:DUF4157 domain-containing protein n=1 Tax=Roseateles aquae TaxID=3077235 RepID=A0ABU3P7Z1_9BURK|nr:DUF4157 domain-containing protein [Paucibacter sp. APW11]MDT8998213.1 DUF4157 domain-containing protein [Paucibacter sp. APW11]